MGKISQGRQWRVLYEYTVIRKSPGPLRGAEPFEPNTAKQSCHPLSRWLNMSRRGLVTRLTLICNHHDPPPPSLSLATFLFSSCAHHPGHGHCFRLLHCSWYVVLTAIPARSCMVDGLQLRSTSHVHFLVL